VSPTAFTGVLWSTREGFTKRYNINRLVYYETFRYIGNAIVREKQVKTLNPTWQDLAEGWGEKAELQIPRFARDDNKSEEQNPAMPTSCKAQRNLTIKD
jgi:hypothetical protein